ncbi:translation elongation factor Ts [Moheibacter sediminis]|uniref:Elongation factor Ts n=1 Tax=Moheibacter sediminis TaxID=1434700 RepID=A0A1W1ZRD6_9FLAO|nr:translation elongation factor Ts [Moheibacter sediminis]SMC51100.1 elongation factor Ts [Moheibacter sediminis]
MYKATAAEVSKLRTATGAGMMDSKKALEEAEGDFEKAIEILRKKGQKVAANRADRESTEGAVIAKVNADNTQGVIVSLNCETDFVGKNEDFIALAHKFADMAFDYADKESFLNADFGGITVAEKLTEQTGVIGEKIEIGTFQKIEGAFVNSYIHAGNKIGAVVALSAKVDGAEEGAREVAMQVAAMNPVALNENEVSADIVEKELEIAKDVLRQEGKAENMIENIAKGKLQKFFKENTLVHQPFIKEAKLTVAEHLKSISPELEVVGFIRYGI